MGNRDDESELGREGCAADDVDGFEGSEAESCGFDTDGSPSVLGGTSGRNDEEGDSSG